MSGGTRNIFHLIEETSSSADRHLLMEQHGVSLALDIENIREIIRVVAIDPLPESSDDTAGVINYRGRIIPVIDLSRLMGKDGTVLNLDMGIVILEIGEMVFGLLARAVVGVQALRVEPRPDDLREDVTWPLISGVSYHSDREKMVLVLNPERLRRHPALEEHENDD